MFIALFFSCKSESLNEYKGDQLKSIQPISVEDARKAFESKYGEKLIIKETFSSLVSNSGDTSQLTIAPIWTDARVAAYLQTTPILLVPIENVSTLDNAKSGYSLVFFRDSLGAIKQRLQVFQADEAYRANNPRYSVDNFSGVFYQINMDGKSQNALKVENGKFVSRIIENSPDLKVRDCPDPGSCYDWGKSWWSKLVNWLVHQGGGPTYVYVTINNGRPDLLNYRDEVNPYVASGGSTNTHVYSNKLADELGDEIFDMTDERASLLNIHHKISLDYGETQFLRTQPSIVAQLELFLNSGSLPAAIRPNLARIHLELLMSDYQYLQKNAQTGLSPSIFGVLNKYLLADFEPLEFARLYTNPVLFTQVDGFLNQHVDNGIFSSSAVETAKFHIENLNNPEYKAFVEAWPTIPAFLWPIIKDVGIEIAVKLIQKYVPGFNEIGNIKNAVSSLNQSDWLGFMHDIYEIAKTEFKSLKKKIPWIAAYEIIFVDGKEYYDKLTKIWAPLNKLGTKLDASEFSKVWNGLSKNGDVLDKIDLFPDNSGFLKYSGGSLKDMFHTIRTEFGVGFQNETSGPSR
jgi:hypothetical protein